MLFDTEFECINQRCQHCARYHCVLTPPGCVEEVRLGWLGFRKIFVFWKNFVFIFAFVFDINVFDLNTFDINELQIKAFEIKSLCLPGCVEEVSELVHGEEVTAGVAIRRQFFTTQQDPESAETVVCLFVCLNVLGPVVLTEKFMTEKVF